jgi:hypothetical protein
MDILAVNNFGDTRSGGLAGPMGLFIIVMMSVALVLLIRNMNKRLRRLPDSFENVDGRSTSNSVADPTADESAARQGEDRLSSTQDPAEAQVSDVPAIDRPAGSDGGAERS